MSDEAAVYLTASSLRQCSQPQQQHQHQQHPLASLASSVQGIQSALAGRSSPSRAPLPVPRRQKPSKGVSAGVEHCLGAPASPVASANSQIAGNGSQRASRAAGLVFATVPGASSILSSADEQPLLLLSDTVRHIFAGTAARTLAQAFIHPLDTIKTRLQVAAPAQELASWRNNVREHPLDLYIGKRRVVHTGNWLINGPRDVYLGLTGAIVGTLPTSLVYFAAYEWCKQQLEKRSSSSSALTHLGSASFGAVASVFVRVPADTVKHRVQAYVFPNVLQATQTIYRSRGLGGFYAGLLPTLLRDVPEIAIQFTLYEKLRQVFQKKDSAKLETWQHLVLGGLSGASAALATTPLDLIKTRLQVGSAGSVRQAVALTVQEQGPKGLFAGLGPRMSQAAAMSALFFTFFEFWKATLKTDRTAADRLLMPKILRKRRQHVWKRQFSFQ
ncbi:hypothetical protein WJX74_006134 [Apatococcus lobatus]|uniref:Mitochondrial carrier protein n=1 Tax=Apatococcus lobatus TaxID=904363 RepID=A0AAW1R1G6_9CHLO